MTPDRRINAAASDLTTPPTEIEIASLLSAISPFPNVALILRRLVFQRDELKVENNQLRRLVDESSLQHAAVDLPAADWLVRRDVTGLDRGWYIVNMKKPFEYLNNEGERQNGVNDSDGKPNAFWPTEAAALEFIRKVANHLTPESRP